MVKNFSIAEGMAREIAPPFAILLLRSGREYFGNLIPWSKNSFTILVIQFVLAQVTDKEVGSAAVSNTSMYRAKKAIEADWKLLSNHRDHA